MIDVSGPLVTFRGTYLFASDGQVLTSDSTLRFRERDEVEVAPSHTTTWSRKSEVRPTGLAANSYSLPCGSSEKHAPPPT